MKQNYPPCYFYLNSSFFQCISIRKLRGLERPLNVIESNYNLAGLISMSNRNIKSVGQSYLRTFNFLGHTNVSSVSFSASLCLHFSLSLFPVSVSQLSLSLCLSLCLLCWKMILLILDLSVSVFLSVCLSLCLSITFFSLLPSLTFSFSLFLFQFIVYVSVSLLYREMHLRCITSLTVPLSLSLTINKDRGTKMAIKTEVGKTVTWGKEGNGRGMRHLLDHSVFRAHDLDLVRVVAEFPRIWSEKSIHDGWVGHKVRPQRNCQWS